MLSLKGHSAIRAAYFFFCVSVMKSHDNDRGYFKAIFTPFSQRALSKNTCLNSKANYLFFSLLNRSSWHRTSYLKV